MENKPSLITVLCERPGFRRYGRPWGLATLVEIVPEGRKPTEGSPAEAAISHADAKDLAWFVETENCPLKVKVEAPSQAELERGQLQAELDAMRADLEKLSSERQRVREELEALEAEHKTLEAEREAMTRQLAEAQDRVRAAEAQAQRFQQDAEDARSALAEMNGGARAKKRG